VSIVNGQRLDLDVITGPEMLVKRTVDWIQRCWHQSLDERPTFAGMSCINLSKL